MLYLSVLISFLISISCWAQNEVVGEKKIIVKEKDTLWSIASREYFDGFMWEKIYQLNKNKIKNPHLIFPGDELILPQGYQQKSFESKNIISNSTVETSSQSANYSLQSSKPAKSQQNRSLEDTKKPQVEILSEPVLNEEMPDSQVFSSFTNKTVLADKEYFNGEIKSILKDDDLKFTSLSESGDELILKVWGESVNIGSIAEIYSKMKEKNGKITAQICGRCEIFYVEHSVARCRLVWVNNLISQGMPVRVK